MTMEIRARALEEAMKIASAKFTMESMVEAAEKIEAYLAGKTAKKECVACDALIQHNAELQSALRVAAAGVSDDRRVIDTLNAVLAVARTMEAPYRADVEYAVERAAVRLEVEL
ncbi:hypothetical protein ACXR2T_10755 [Leucobacter sp. HY1910]